MKNIARLTVFILTAVAFMAPAATGAWAQNANDIVKSLSVKKPKTRGFKADTPQQIEEKKRTRQFINRLKTRQIMVEEEGGGQDKVSVAERKELKKIIKKHKMPSIDLVIYFEYDSARITQDSLPTMIQLGRALSSEKLKGASFLLAGHTDAQGSDGYNLKLSRRRAASVKRFLVEQFSLKAKDLIAVGYGEEQTKPGIDPYAPENRRVQVTNLAYQ